MNSKEDWSIVERIGSRNKTLKDIKDIQNLLHRRLKMKDIK